MAYNLPPSNCKLHADDDNCSRVYIEVSADGKTWKHAALCSMGLSETRTAEGATFSSPPIDFSVAAKEVRLLRSDNSSVFAQFDAERGQRYGRMTLTFMIRGGEPWLVGCFFFEAAAGPDLALRDLVAEAEEPGRFKCEVKVRGR